MIKTNDGRRVLNVEINDNYILGTVMCDGYKLECVWDISGVFHHDPENALTIKELNNEHA